MAKLMAPAPIQPDEPVVSLPRMRRSVAATMGLPAQEDVMMATPNAKAPVGQGGRFAALKAKIAARGGVRDPGAVAAAIGRAKYGKARFQKMAAAGRKSAHGSGPFSAAEMKQGYKRLSVAPLGPMETMETKRNEG